jgi:hypothetical protein
VRVVIAVVGLAYPLLIYGGLVLVGPRTLAAPVYGDLLDPVLRRVFPPSAAGGGH